MFTSESSAARTKNPSPELLDAHRELARIANSKLEDKAPDTFGRRHAFLRFREPGTDRMYAIIRVPDHRARPGAGGLFVEGLTLSEGLADEMLVAIQIPQREEAVDPDTIHGTSGLTASGLKRLASELEKANPVSEQEYRDAYDQLIRQHDLRLHF